jgi:hypothetical protein
LFKKPLKKSEAHSCAGFDVGVLHNENFHETDFLGITQDKPAEQSLCQAERTGLGKGFAKIFQEFEGSGALKRVDG